MALQESHGQVSQIQSSSKGCPAWLGWPPPLDSGEHGEDTLVWTGSKTLHVVVDQSCKAWQLPGIERLHTLSMQDRTSTKEQTHHNLLVSGPYHDSFWLQPANNNQSLWTIVNLSEKWRWLMSDLSIHLWQSGERNKTTRITMLWTLKDDIKGRLINPWSSQTRLSHYHIHFNEMNRMTGAL